LEKFILFFPSRFCPFGAMRNRQWQPQPTLQHICKPSRADTQTKGSQKSCNLAFAHCVVHVSHTFYIVKRDKKSIFEDSILKSMNRIKEVLEEKGIKQKWLAEKLGKSYNMVNGYVQNRQQPKLEILFEIAEILDVKPQDLIKDKK
jgi:ribosome-binding protein aMBF1 (putative translation factor)